MKPIWSIFKKEFFSFLTTPQFYLTAGLVTVILSWIYPTSLSLFKVQAMTAVYQPGMPSQQLNIHYGVFLRLLSYLNLILILVVPAITMRLFSEEKKLRTFDLLLTSPVTSLQIVLGKFLAAGFCVASFILIGFLYPMFTAFFVSFTWSTLLVAFLGIFLIAMVYVAIDLFCSSLTESIMISYVLAVILNISIWFIGMGVDVVDSAWARSAFEHISLSQHLGGLVEGTVRSQALLFFVTVIGLFVFLSERVVEATRWR